MSHALLAIQNILQNSNIFIGSRETVFFTSFGKKKVTQFSGLPPTSVNYLKLSYNKCLELRQLDRMGDTEVNDSKSQATFLHVAFSSVVIRIF